MCFVGFDGVWIGLFGESPFAFVGNGGKGWEMTAPILCPCLFFCCCFEVSNNVGGFCVVWAVGFIGIVC